MLQGDEEMMQRALQTMQSVLERCRDEKVGLRVRLLSGRCCHKLFDCRWNCREDVLRICVLLMSGRFEWGQCGWGQSDIPHVLGANPSHLPLCYGKEKKSKDKRKKRRTPLAKKESKSSSNRIYINPLKPQTLAETSRSLAGTGLSR